MLVAANSFSGFLSAFFVSFVVAALICALYLSTVLLETLRGKKVSFGYLKLVYSYSVCMGQMVLLVSVEYQCVSFNFLDIFKTIKKTAIILFLFSIY